MREPVQVRQGKSCDDCGFKTTSECVLKKHIEITHTDNKKKKSKPSTRLHCDSCEKYFYKKDKLSEHRRTMHKEENLPINNNYINNNPRGTVTSSAVKTREASANKLLLTRS